MSDKGLLGAAVATPEQTTPGGAFVQHDYVGVRMTIYPIDESRLEQLSATNDHAAALFSAGSAFLFFALGLCWNVCTAPAEPKTPAIAVLFTVVCFVLAATCFVLGILARKKKTSILDGIKNSAIRGPELEAMKDQRTAPSVSAS